MKGAAFRFPADVRAAMDATGSAITCVPVQLDGGDWESAMFFRVDGPECERDIAFLASTRTVPVELDAEAIKHENAAIAMLRLEVMSDTANPLVGEMLLLPGGNPTHFETLQSLACQARLGIFLADQQYDVVLSQFMPLSDAHRREFRALLDECVRHDAIVRMTGRYDAAQAFTAVVSNYALRGERSEPR